MKNAIVLMTRQVLHLMTDKQRDEAERLIATLERTANADAESLEDFTRRAGAAFERDMRPIREALVAALKAGDMAALLGLRALLPHLLAGVNDKPELSALFEYQFGHDFVAALTGGHDA